MSARGKAERALQGALVRLIVRANATSKPQPFFTSLLFNLGRRVAQPGQVSAIGIDGRHLLYEPRAVARLAGDEVEYALARSALHCALQHPWRRGSRDAQRWEAAASISTNNSLAEMGFRLPERALVDKTLADLTAEQIYDRLGADARGDGLVNLVVPQPSSGSARRRHAKRPSRPGRKSPDRDSRSRNGLEMLEKDDGHGQEKGKDGQAKGEGQDQGDDGQGKDGEARDDSHHAQQNDGHGPDRGGGDGSAGSGGGNIGGDGGDGGGGGGGDGGDGGDGDGGFGNPRSESELQQLWAQHTRQAIEGASGNGDLPGNLMRQLLRLTQPTVPWQEKLAPYFEQVAREDYSYSRFNRRGEDAGLILPGKDGTSGKAVVVVDTSGSMGQKDVERGMSELNAILGTNRVQATLLAADAAVQGHKDYEVGEAVEPLDVAVLKGGGGTDFRPVFKYVERNGLRPDVMVFFTDANGDFPRSEPGYPVLWLVNNSTHEVPWGERIEMTE